MRCTGKLTFYANKDFTLAVTALCETLLCKTQIKVPMKV